MSLPEYDFIPAPLWLLTVLHILTLTLHFVAMNFVLGGMVVILFGRFKKKWQHPVVERFVNLFPNIMAATVTLGVAPLLFVQLVYGKLIYSASIVSAWFWLSIFAVVMVSYYLLYAISMCDKASDNRRSMSLFFSLIGLVYVSYVYSSVFSLAERPELIGALYASDQSGGVMHALTGLNVLRWMHMLSGAIMVGGFFVGWLGKDHKHVYNLGRNFFRFGLAVTTVFGVVYMLLFDEHLGVFMRSSGIWLVSISLVITLVALGLYYKKQFVLSGTMLFLSVLGMVLARHIVRLIFLTGKFDPLTLTVEPKWGLFALFFICFLVAIALVSYMLRLFCTE